MVKYYDTQIKYIVLSTKYLFIVVCPLCANNSSHNHIYIYMRNHGLSTPSTTNHHKIISASNVTNTHQTKTIQMCKRYCRQCHNAIIYGKLTNPLLKLIE